MSRLPLPNWKSEWEPKLLKAGLKKEQISIVVHNLVELPNPRIVKNILTNIINDTSYRMKFFQNPKELIGEANPQPSP